MKNGSLSSTDFILVIMISVGLIAPLITCMAYSDDIRQLQSIIGEVAAILTQEELQRPEKSDGLPEHYDIKVENIRFGYHDKEVLHGISLEIEEGTVNAIVGPSGSGKSTLAKLFVLTGCQMEQKKTK